MFSLVFDSTRNTRQEGASREHRLTLTMPLQPQKVLLTVAQCWGVGKGKVVNVLKADHTLPSIGSVSASEAEVVQEATSFMAACYGENKSTTMIAVRRRVSHSPQQMNHFCSMQSDPTFRRAFGDTQMSLARRC